ncbi:hypothetical protein HID58_096037 [Brassica napus]|uniref:Uncharacterized protein n=1 Tax=Brassica napus TaxID=3708 RepID=A0ABQ7X1M1_BRANA|nr:hypothetical protein HID58_096037 [Brassica napus]
MYSPDTVIAFLWEKKFRTRSLYTSTRHCSVRLSPIAENSPLLPPVGVWAVSQSSVADHPLGPATDHRLAVSSCCSPPKGRFLRVTHPSATGNTTSRPTCMYKADSELSFIPSQTCIHALHIRMEFAPRNIATPTPSRQSHELLSILIRYSEGASQNRTNSHSLGLGIIRARTDDFHHVKCDTLPLSYIPSPIRK